MAPACRSLGMDAGLSASELLSRPRLTPRLRTSIKYQRTNFRRARSIIGREISVDVVGVMRMNSQTLSEERIAAELEKLWHQDVLAINARNWSRETSPIFRQKTQSWGATYAGDDRIGLDEWVAILSDMTSEHPDMQIEVSRLKTYVDEKAGSAKMFANKEMSGRHSGVVLRSVVTIFWTRDDGGVWWNMGHASMPGWDCEVD